MKPTIRIDNGKRRVLDKERIAARMAGVERHKPTPEEAAARARAAEKRAKLEARDANRPRGEPQVQRLDNPYFSRAHPAGKAGNHRKIDATVNIRESAIATMAARGHLDAAQVAAADRFRASWEALGGAGASAMDYTREPVSGGATAETLTVGQIAVGREMKRCRELLGARSYELVSKVCGEGLSLAEVSPVKRDRLTAADNLRAALDDLATMWGIAVRPGRGSVVDKDNPPPPGPAGLGKLRGELSEPVKHDVSAPVDTAWAEAQNDRRRERAVRKGKRSVNAQRTTSAKS